MNSKGNDMELSIEHFGVRYCFSKSSDCKLHGGLCDTCLEEHKQIHDICRMLPLSWLCTSATKIEDEAKIYGPHNSDKASHLKNKIVEMWHPGNNEDGIVWEKTKLGCQIDYGSTTPFYSHERSSWHSIIREIKPETITLTEARRRFNIPDNVFIDGE